MKKKPFVGGKVPILAILIAAYPAASMLYAQNVEAWHLPSKDPQQQIAKWLSPVPLVQALRVQLPKPEADLVAWRPDQTRGPSEIAVYEKVAPAVVYVTDGRTGHGTGMFIRDDGWILTNNHVVEHMPYSTATRSQTARIVWGKLVNNGGMQAVPGYVDAVVYRRSNEFDLALLKLTRLPEGVQKTPAVTLAPNSPPLGANCMAIGHPRSGVMWMLRTGIISGKGKFPQDQIGTGFLKGTDQAEEAQLTSRAAQLPARQVTLSTCGVNPGDSGGPLVDEQGRLVAVSFAVPAVGTDQKFSYHVHLDDVKEFLKSYPDRPELMPPSHIPGARYVQAQDMDRDGTVDSLVSFEDPDEDPIGLLVDLDQDSRLQETGKSLSSEKLSAIDPSRDWDFEMAITQSPTAAIFFDKNNDRQIDFIHMLREKEPALRFELRNGTWEISTSTDPIPQEPFTNSGLNARYQLFARRLGIIDVGKKK